MKKNIFALFVLFVLALTLAGCGEEKRENRLPPVEGMSLYDVERASTTAPQPAADDRELAAEQEAEYAPMGYTDKAAYYADQGADAFWDAGKWTGKKLAVGMELVLVLALPYLIIFLIPGVLAGRAEKLVEGAALAGIGVLLAITANEYLTTFAVVAAIWGLVIPGVILLIWGIASEREEGKMAILLTSSGSLAIYLLWVAWEFLVWGLVTWGILAIVVLILLGGMGVKVGKAFVD